MRIIEKIKDKKNLTYLGILLLGILLGWIFFGGDKSGQAEENAKTDQSVEQAEAPGTIWTCSMHPQIQQDKPGNCPICGMELIPMNESEGSSSEAGQFTVSLTDAAMKIAEVSVSRIEKKSPYKEVYLPGKVQADERRIAELTARYPGRIEKLNVNFTGQKVSKGEVLARIYSPELVTAQKEMFEAMKYRDTNPKYYEAARNKLKLWDLTEEQIDEIAGSGEVMFYFNVLSPLSGTVTMRHVAQGDYVKEGTPLFKVIDLNHVWVIFDAYESDLPWIRRRDKIEFTIKSIPDRKFESTVTFIDPVINPMTRVAGVRAELNNRGDMLKPEMLVSGVLKAMLPGNSEELVVPKSAILWTGKKAVVYVKTGDRDNMFQYREIDLGAEAGDYYVVDNGLQEGEWVASNGVFKIDAAAQLRGEKSMMNPEGGKVSMAHNHGNMDMGSSTETGEMKNMDGDMQSEPAIASSVDPAFTRQLTRVYEKYMDYKNALVQSDPVKEQQALNAMKEALDETDMSLLGGNANTSWMESLNKISEATGKAEGKQDLEQFRRALAPISEALFRSIKQFGVDENTVYYQYCPMAIGNQGAYWLSEEKDINNPYFGETMLKCGETRETIAD